MASEQCSLRFDPSGLSEKEFEEYIKGIRLFYNYLSARAKEILKEAKAFLEGVLKRDAYISQNPNSNDEEYLAYHTYMMKKHRSIIARFYSVEKKAILFLSKIISEGASRYLGDDASPEEKLTETADAGRFLVDKKKAREAKKEAEKLKFEANCAKRYYQTIRENNNLLAAGFDPAQLTALFAGKFGGTNVEPSSPEKRQRSPEKRARAEHTSPKKRGRD